MKDITYFFKSDSLHITMLEEEPHSDSQEFQDGVLLYRNQEEEIVSIEIFGFSVFHENRIKTSDREYLELASAFRQIRMGISLRDIMFSKDEELREEFKETCRSWNLNIELPDLKKMEDQQQEPQFTLKVYDLPLIEVEEPCY